MRKLTLLTILLAGTACGLWAQNDYDDDIYFNPNQKKEKKQKETKSAYIKDFSSIDVDEYNRRGQQYYMSPVDTIGDATGSAQDFVYTQQIQKYINPTIVVENADALAGVLENSYGNVEIVIDNGIPVFNTVYFNYGLPSYYRPSYVWGAPYWDFYTPSWAYYSSPYWNFWGPAWSYGWGPAWNWGWGPSWAWGWGTSWGWTWGGGCHGSHHHNSHYMANHYRPNANRNSFRPQSGWASNTRPGGGGVTNGGSSNPSGRPAGRPSSSGTGFQYNAANHRVNANSVAGAQTSQVATGSVSGRVPTTGYQRQTANSALNASRTEATKQTQTAIGGLKSTDSSRTNSTGTVRNSSTSTQRSYNSGTSTQRSYNSGTSTQRSYNSGTSTQRSYNSGSSSRGSSYNSGSSRSSGSFGSGRSSGGSYGGGRSSGGGSGRHR